MTQNLENVHNFRRVPGTKLYRSGRPDNMTREGLQLLDHLGIGCIIDLRSQREYSVATGDKLLDQHLKLTKVTTRDGVINYTSLSNHGDTGGIDEVTSCVDQFAGHHYLFNLISPKMKEVVTQQVPLYAKILLFIFHMMDMIFKSNLHFKFLVIALVKHFGFIQYYKNIVDCVGDTIYSVLHLMSEADNSPAIVCCRYGRDRTGLICALVLGCLGKSKEFIAQDFDAQSSAAFHKQLGEDDEIVKNYSKFLGLDTANYGAMMQLLEYIDHRYGSISGYLSSIGMDLAEQEKLRHNFLDPE